MSVLEIDSSVPEGVARAVLDTEQRIERCCGLPQTRVVDGDPRRICPDPTQTHSVEAFLTGCGISFHTLEADSNPAPHNMLKPA